MGCVEESGWPPQSEAPSPSSLILGGDCKGIGPDKKSLTNSFFLLKAHIAIYRDIRKHEKANKTYIYFETGLALQPRLAEDS